MILHVISWRLARTSESCESWPRSELAERGVSTSTEALLGKVKGTRMPYGFTSSSALKHGPPFVADMRSKTLSTISGLESPSHKS